MGEAKRSVDVTISDMPEVRAALENYKAECDRLRAEESKWHTEADRLREQNVELRLQRNDFQLRAIRAEQALDRVRKECDTCVCIDTGEEKK